MVAMLKIQFPSQGVIVFPSKEEITSQLKEHALVNRQVVDDKIIEAVAEYFAKTEYDETFSSDLAFYNKIHFEKSKIFYWKSLIPLDTTPHWRLSKAIASCAIIQGTNSGSGF